MPQVRLEKSSTITTAINNVGVTTTSSEINCMGFNAALVGITITGTGTWKVDLKGRLDSSGTVMDIQDNIGSQLTTGNITTSILRTFVGVPDLLTVVATEISDGATCSVRIQPINI